MTFSPAGMGRVLVFLMLIAASPGHELHAPQHPGSTIPADPSVLAGSGPALPRGGSTRSSSR
jgi:hypothetical protein